MIYKCKLIIDGGVVAINGFSIKFKLMRLFIDGVTTFRFYLQNPPTYFTMLVEGI